MRKRRKYSGYAGAGSCENRCYRKADGNRLILMRTIVVGLGVQGYKRRRFAGDECVGSVDPVNEEATWRRLEDVPLESYDTVLACIPDLPKLEVLSYCIEHGKHILVEKPLWAENAEE